MANLLSRLALHAAYTQWADRLLGEFYGAQRTAAARLWVNGAADTAGAFGAAWLTRLAADVHELDRWEVLRWVALPDRRPRELADFAPGSEPPHGDGLDANLHLAVFPDVLLLVGASGTLMVRLGGQPTAVLAALEVLRGQGVNVRAAQQAIDQSGWSGLAQEPAAAPMADGFADLLEEWRSVRRWALMQDEFLPPLPRSGAMGGVRAWLLDVHAVQIRPLSLSAAAHCLLACRPRIQVRAHDAQTLRVALSEGGGEWGGRWGAGAAGSDVMGTVWAGSQALAHWRWCEDAWGLDEGRAQGRDDGVLGATDDHSVVSFSLLPLAQRVEPHALVCALREAQAGVAQVLASRGVWPAPAPLAWRADGRSAQQWMDSMGMAGEGWPAVAEQSLAALEGYVTNAALEVDWDPAQQQVMQLRRAAQELLELGHQSGRSGDFGGRTAPEDQAHGLRQRMSGLNEGRSTGLLPHWIDLCAQASQIASGLLDPEVSRSAQTQRAAGADQRQR